MPTEQFLYVIAVIGFRNSIRRDVFRVRMYDLMHPRNPTLVSIIYVRYFYLEFDSGCNTLEYKNSNVHENLLLKKNRATIIKSYTIYVRQFLIIKLFSIHLTLFLPLFRFLTTNSDYYFVLFFTIKTIIDLIINITITSRVERACCYNLYACSN